MVEIIIGHLRVTKRGIIGMRPSIFQLYFFGFAEWSVDDMYLPAAFQMRKTQVKYPFCRREMLERSGKENKIKAPVAQQTRTDVPVDEPEVGVVAEYTGGLLQFGKIDVDTG